MRRFPGARGIPFGATHVQLYFAIGVPSLVIAVIALAVLVGILINRSRLTDLRTAIDKRFDMQMGSIEARLGSLEGKFDLMLGKIMEMYTRLSVLEDRLKR